MSKKHNISVQTQVRFIQNQSSVADNRYVFAYTITITNTGIVAARLLSRHWLITDANGKVQEVNGSGVIGKQPYLKPGKVFRYTSGAIIETAVGVMQGKYLFESDDGSQFAAPVPKFTLSIPRTLH